MHRSATAGTAPAVPAPPASPARRPAAGGRRRALAVALLAALGCLAASLAAPAAATPPTAEPSTAGGLTESEVRGKRIYLAGESDEGEILALMGDGGIEVPASALPCSSCHGRDGRGQPEGGVQPSDLTWEALTRPYVVTTATGRRREPYTPSLLKRAILLGLDASGNELDSVMPRYRLTHRQADDLLAYLRKLGRDRDPGVAEDALTLGVLLPPREAASLAPLAKGVRSVVDAYVGRVNDGGGVYHRRLDVHYLPLPLDPSVRPAALRTFAAEVEPFALVASFTAGADAELAEAAGDLELPLVGALTLHPDESFPLNRHVFYLDSGLPGQLRALVGTAATLGDGEAPRSLALLHPADDLSATAAREAEDAARLDAFTSVRRVDFPAGGFDAAATVDDLGRDGFTDVILIAPGEEEGALMERAAAAGWAPRLWIAGAFAGAEVFTPRPGFGGRLFLGLNALPNDRTPPGEERFRTATGDPDLPMDSTRIATFQALELLVAGLEETGRDLTRESLIEKLELVRGRPTGLSRPVSFGPNRRVAVRGAYVVELDPAAPRAPLGVRWVEGE